MEISNLYKERIFNKIEDACCKCASEYFNTEVDKEGLYKARRLNLPASIARGISLVIMHDFYAMTYTDIFKHTQMGIKSVMMRVRIVRDMIETDSLYSKIFEKIKSRL